VVKWRSPPPGWVKVNWDVAVDKSNGRIGLGVVIRDHTGKLCAAKSLTRIGFLEPVAAEAMAVLVAVQLCGELGFHRDASFGCKLQFIDGSSARHHILS
jgi:hypothetical protein